MLASFSKLELHPAGGGSSRSAEAVLEICLIKYIVRPNEEADGLILLHGNPVAGARIHFVDASEPKRLRDEIAVDGRQVAAGGQGVDGEREARGHLVSHQQGELISRDHEAAEHIANNGNALQRVDESVSGGDSQGAAESGGGAQ